MKQKTKTKNKKIKDNFNGIWYDFQTGYFKSLLIIPSTKTE